MVPNASGIAMYRDDDNELVNPYPWSSTVSSHLEVSWKTLSEIYKGGLGDFYVTLESGILYSVRVFLNFHNQSVCTLHNIVTEWKCPSHKLFTLLS